MALEFVPDPDLDDLATRAVAAALAQEGLTDDVRPGTVDDAWFRAGLQDAIERHVIDPDPLRAVRPSVDYAPLPRRTRGATRA